MNVIDRTMPADRKMFIVNEDTINLASKLNVKTNERLGHLCKQIEGGEALKEIKK